jgi:AraC-like DNA-binding protein
VADAVFSELLSQNGRSVIYLPRPDPVISAFNETIRWSLSRESMSSLIAMGGSCMHLLGLIIHGKRPAAHKARAAEERISESIVLIKNTLNEPLTLKQLAAEARLSVPHYASLFKKKTGSSPIQMYAQMRIQLACDLLDRSNLSVSAVSDECGYSDPFYFSRTFKRIVGLAPTQYRDKSPNYHAYIDNLKRSQ